MSLRRHARRWIILPCNLSPTGANAPVTKCEEHWSAPTQRIRSWAAHRVTSNHSMFIYDKIRGSSELGYSSIGDLGFGIVTVLFLYTKASWVSQKLTRPFEHNLDCVCFRYGHLARGYRSQWNMTHDVVYQRFDVNLKPKTHDLCNHIANRSWYWHIWYSW